MSKLLTAALAVKKDLLMRAEVDSEGIKIVDVSNSIWRNFCEAIELENTRTQSQWISDERLKELCESYVEYSHLSAVLRAAPNFQNWLIEQGLSNPLAPPKVSE